MKFLFSALLILLFSPLGLAQGHTVSEPPSEWMKLLHYHRQDLKWIPQIDDPHFYVTSQGNLNPQKEWEESLRLFEIEPENYQCRYPRRAQFLLENQWIKTRATCLALEEWLSRLSPMRAELIFAGPFMGNPSSLFGHTFIKIYSKPKAQGRIDYGVNYSALTGHDSGLLYAFRGLFGSYSGGYALKPFDDLTREYTHLEGRNLTMYPLQLTEKELYLLVLHLLELDQIKIPYYFFTRNCASELMDLMQGAWPEQNLELPGLLKLPVTSIKTLGAAGVIDVTHPTFKLALKTQIEDLYEKLSKREKSAARDLIGTLASGGVPEERGNYSAPLIDLGLLYGASLQMKKPTAALSQSLFVMKQQRSKLGTRPQTPPPAPLLSHLSHEARRMQMGVVHNKAYTSPLITLGIRLTYHDLLDSNVGMLKGTQIEMGNLEVGLAQVPVLKQLTVFHLTSFYPVSDLYNNTSWSFKIDSQQKYLKEQWTGITFSYGKTIQSDRLHLTSALKSETMLLDKWGHRSGLQIISPELTLFSSTTRQFTTMAQVKWPLLAVGNHGKDYLYHLDWSVGLDYAFLDHYSARFVVSGHRDFVQTHGTLQHYF